MSRFMLTFALAAGLVAGAGHYGMSVKAEDKKGEEKKDAPAPATPESKALSALAGAYKMVDYGREKQVPEALLLAARVIGTTDTQKPDPKKITLSKKDLPEYDDLKTATDLIAEALKMKGGDTEAVKLLAKSVEGAIKEAKRGRIGGPTAIPGTMIGNDDFDTFRISFQGGRPAEVIVRVEPNIADVDLRIVDSQTGNVVAQDRRANDDCFARWTPPANRQYIIELRNYKRNINVRYTLFTN